MGHIRNILVPMDGSPASIEALDRAVTLEQDVGAAVAVLHVTAPEMAAKDASLEAEQRMEEAVSSAKSKLGEKLSRQNTSGDPLRKILEMATEDTCDLIILGTHGRVGRLHALVGSVAEGVVRNAPCPVMTVRRPDGEEESFAERIHGREGLSEQARVTR